MAMFFEDFEPGQVFTTASHTISEQEIIEFASQWDKQPFHLDHEAAAASIYGGLIASGFHTLLISFNLVVEAAVWTKSSQGSPGMETIRFLRPVRPGDRLTVDFQVVSVRSSSTRGDRGYVLWDHTTKNQSGEDVLTFRSTGISLRRNSAVDLE
ncbi:MAG: MaoC family dehydratase [Pseudomonadota bacterium]